jgi:hypothetical protein
LGEKVQNCRRLITQADIKGQFVEAEDASFIQEAKSLRKSVHGQRVHQNVLASEDVGQAAPCLINFFGFDRFLTHFDNEMVFDKVGKALLKDKVGTESE